MARLAAALLLLAISVGATGFLASRGLGLHGRVDVGKHRGAAADDWRAGFILASEAGTGVFVRASVLMRSEPDQPDEPDGRTDALSASFVFHRW